MIKNKRIIKVLLKPIIIIRKIYWRLVRPTTIGVRAIILDDEDKVLLVKHTYTKEWYLPGGKVHKNEIVFDAIRRELREEIGMYEIQDISILSVYSNFREYKNDYIIVFVVKGYEIKKIVHFEVDKFAFFSFESLPTDASNGTKNRLHEFFNKKTPKSLW